MNSHQFYKHIEEAVKDGASYGYMRAFKHTDSPGEELIIQSIIDNVMIELEDVIDFGLLERAVTVLEEIAKKIGRDIKDDE